LMDLVAPQEHLDLMEQADLRDQLALLDPPGHPAHPVPLVRLEVAVPLEPLDLTALLVHRGLQDLLDPQVLLALQGLLDLQDLLGQVVHLEHLDWTVNPTQSLISRQTPVQLQAILV
jgi:hypothetical protein